MVVAKIKSSDRRPDFAIITQISGTLRLLHQPRFGDEFVPEMVGFFLGKILGRWPSVVYLDDKSRVGKIQADPRQVDDLTLLIYRSRRKQWKGSPRVFFYLHFGVTLFL